jgi:hypothetical protein
MDFLDRSVLVALVALAIPLAIHLLGRRRARKVTLPTMRFAQGAHRASRTRVRLRQAGLLAARLAAVALAVVALAGPRVGGGEAGKARWALVLDNSAAMDALAPGAERPAEAAATSRVEPRPERPREQAQADAVPNDRRRGGDGSTDERLADVARARLLEVLRRLPAGADVTLVRTDGLVAQGAAAARGALEMPPPARPGQQSLGALLARFASPADASNAQAEIVFAIASSGTAHAARDLSPGLFPAGVRAVILPPPAAGLNACLGLPRTQVTDAPAGRMLAVEVDVAGPAALAPRVVLTGAGLDDAASASPHGGTAAVPQGGTARFVVPVSGDGPWQGEVRLMDAAGSPVADAVAADNVRFFTAGVPAPVRVLVVDAAAEADARLRSADLVAAAFAGPGPFPTPVTRRTAADAASGAPAQVAAADLDAADVVFWVGSAAPSAGIAGRLAAARVVWVPADAASPDAALAGALGIVFEGVAEAPDGVTLDPGGYASPLLEAFEGGTSGDVAAPVFRRRVRLGGEGGAEVRFQDGTPAIRTRDKGGGRTVLLAFGPATFWGDLAGRPEWVVLVRSLAGALAPRGRNWANRVLDASAGDQISGVFSGPGNYILAPSEGGPTHVSLNLDAAETADLTPHPERLAAAFADGAATVVNADSGLETAISGLLGDSGTDLTPYVALVLAAVLAAEGLLSGRHAPRPAATGAE